MSEYGRSYGREDYAQKLGKACQVLELERLRRVAKVAHEEMMHQARATAQQAQLDPDFATDDIPTAADPGDETAQAGAAPLARVWAPEGSGRGTGRVTA